ncbi:copper resistance protein CopC [Jeotgalibacillus sp. R-1-5s-1]|uniref:copper resistance CopC family protein n=1 Tax=Jeotgalibacillus sp. R-1-5s-1 TaxID=2555897 RepID=UPI00106AD998|nr:copper resistance protein CopC [Jeotgalibacillus sp. R-1-5s-1]TFD92866.1 copper resistance protein CopC [Jeotgalibacillus sp. R-1-5s-1]
MMKKYVMAVGIGFLLSAQSAFAHTHMTGSSPEDGAVIETETTEISVQFDTPIEESGVITITDANGQDVPVEEITTGDGELIATLASPLENGDFDAEWNIIGEDGHEMEGSFSFTIAIAEEAVEENTEASSEEAVMEEEPEEVATETTDSETQEENQRNPIVVPASIGLLTLAAAGGAIFFMRRKK